MQSSPLAVQYSTANVGIVGLAGDLIQVDLAASVEIVEITNVDYETNTLTLASAISWEDGACATYPYNGVAPDMGVLESGGSPP